MVRGDEGFAHLRNWWSWRTDCDCWEL